MGKLTAKRVERILSENRYSEIMEASPRDSDKVLIVQYLQYSGCYLTAAQIEVIKGVNFESITRARRKFQENGEYLSSKEVVAERQRRADAMRTSARDASPERLQEIINGNV